VLLGRNEEQRDRGGLFHLSKRAFAMNYSNIHHRSVTRAPLIATLFTLTALCSSGLAQPAERGGDEQPNILFLLSDDQRWDTLGCMGNPVVRTPNLDALAADGVLFSNMFVTTSICNVSRCSILTGTYARFRGVGDGVRMSTPTDWAATYPAVLQKAGYVTGYIGKWNIGPLEEGFQAGAALFDFWNGDRHHGNYWHDFNCPFVTKDGWTNKGELKCTCPPKGSWPRTGYEGMREPLNTDREIVPLKTRLFLRGRDKSKPFMLAVAFRSPKDPWPDYPNNLASLYESDAMPIPATASAEDAARQPQVLRTSLGSDRGKKLAGDHAELTKEIRMNSRQITNMDQAVGELRRILEEEGVAKNTIIIFTSDNGYYYGDHGLWGKWTAYDPSIRVPLVVFDPRAKRAQRGVIRKEMVLNIDLAPTMIALGGAPVPVVMQGRDFTPLLRGESTSWRTDWFYEHTWTAEGRIAPTEAVRSAEWKYIRYPNEKPMFEQLFHLMTDPDESTDLIHDPKYAATADFMREKLATYVHDLAPH